MCLPGPVIRAEEEDTIKVTFKNKATRPYTIQPHGVQYEIQEDGTLYHNVLEGNKAVLTTNNECTVDSNSNQMFLFFITIQYSL